MVCACVCFAETTTHWLRVVNVVRCRRRYGRGRGRGRRPPNKLSDIVFVHTKSNAIHIISKDEECIALASVDTTYDHI